MSLSGVVALLSGNAARWTSLTLVPKPHAPLLWLLNNLDVRGCLYWGASERREKVEWEFIRCCVTYLWGSQCLDCRALSQSQCVNTCQALSLANGVVMFAHETSAVCIRTDYICGKELLTLVQRGQAPSIHTCKKPKEN